MNNPPQLPPAMDKDGEHLKLLSIFHYINAALLLGGTAFLILHFFMMRFFMEQAEAHPSPRSTPVPEELKHLMVIFYVIFGIGFLFVAFFNVFSGLSIRKRKRRMLSLITAAFNCIQFPLGTTLGAFTIIVLCRDSVRIKYDAVADTEAETPED